MRPLPYLLAALFLGQLAAELCGQLPIQPGDIPAPVVEASGGLTASVTCPRQVKAGSVLVLDASGSSTGETELIIRPTVPSGAVYWDSDGQHVAVWIARTGHYKAILIVTAGSDIETDAVAFEVVGSDVPIPPEDPPNGDDPPDDPPADDAFTKRVKALTLEVEGASNHETVAAMFRGLAGKIDAGDLLGSKVILAATKEALFGPGGTENAAWGSWWAMMRPYLLDELRLSTQEAWSEHYKAIAAVVDS